MKQTERRYKIMEQSTERKNKIINKKIETTSKENCIKKVFERLRKEKEKAFIPFLTIGDPDEKTFLHIVEKIKNDIDILELGIPFSDPIADGKTIQKANHRALNKGINLQSSFSLIKKAKQIIKKPIVLLTYANILGLGEQREYSLKRFKKAGVDGIIIADVPVEEAGNYHRLLTKYGIKLILLATPQTT